MKKSNIICALVFLFLITGTLFYCVHMEVSPPDTLEGELFDVSADWELEEQNQTLTYTARLPETDDAERLLLLQSHWT